MQAGWLNLVLQLTNRIYIRKQDLFKASGLSAVGIVFALIGLEIYLAFVSLPLYLSLRPQKVAAWFSDKKTYDKIVFDFNLRRVLTLTSLGIIALLWAIKLTFIIAVPKVYGPLQLYGVTNFQPLDINNAAQVAAQAQIQTAPTVKSLVKPELKSVTKISSGNYVFAGLGKPGTTVTLLISDQQVAVNYGDVGQDGKWQIEHDQKLFKLSDGNHAILMYSYDNNLKVRSEMTDSVYFKVSSSWVDVLVRDVDVLANWSVVLIIILGIVLTILTI